MNGKGSRRRPQYVTDAEFAENWDTIFGPRRPTWPDGAPGSDRALKKGCLCAVLDNSHGKGRGGNGKKWGWWITETCPLHGGKQ